MTIENTSKITKVDSIRVGLAPPDQLEFAFQFVLVPPDHEIVAL